MSQIEQEFKMDDWQMLMDDVESFRGGEFDFGMEPEIIHRIRNEIYEEIRQKREIKKKNALKRMEKIEREKEWRRQERRKWEQEQRGQEREKKRVFDIIGPSTFECRMPGLMSGYPPEFYDIRPYIVSRDAGICPICDRLIDRPVVHHIDQDRFNNSPYNLIAVCSTACHHAKGMHSTCTDNMDAHLMVYLQVLAQCRQEGIF
jgi:hypothetical protein